MLRSLPALFLMGLCLVGACALMAQEPQKEPAEGSLTIEEVLKLSKAGVSDELIIARVKRNGKAFDLNSDEIVALKNDGVSENVIKYLLDPTLPYSPATIAPPPPPPIPLDPLARKVPPERGMYYLDPMQQFQALDLKTVVPYKQPGKLSKFGVGSHVIGSLVGAAAKTRVMSGSAVFYFRLPDKTAIDDIALLRVERAKNQRHLDFGTKPGKPVFPVKSVQQYDSKEAGPGLFRLMATINDPGEYLFFILGSGDDKKGLLGKGYDFGVE